MLEDDTVALALSREGRIDQLPSTALRPAGHRRNRRLLALDPRCGQSGSVPKRRWSNLSPRTRRLLLIGGAFEGVLKTAALVDLARRRADEVHGSRPLWAAAIVVVNSVGAVPIAYFAYGRARA